MRYLGQNFGETDQAASRRRSTGERSTAPRGHAPAARASCLGYAMRDRVIEITEVRVVALGDRDGLGTAAGADRRRRPEARDARIYFAVAGSTADLPPRAAARGCPVTGPALIEEMDSTSLLHPDDVAEVRADGSFVMSAGRGRQVADAATKGRLAPESDPTTLTVVSNALRNISDEMGSAMVRTAYSPIFSKSRDFSCLLFDRRLAHDRPGRNNPAIICAGLHTVPHCVEEFGANLPSRRRRRAQRPLSRPVPHAGAPAAQAGVHRQHADRLRRQHRAYR